MVEFTPVIQIRGFAPLLGPSRKAGPSQNARNALLATAGLSMAVAVLQQREVCHLFTIDDLVGHTNIMGINNESLLLQPLSQSLVS